MVQGVAGDYEWKTYLSLREMKDRYGECTKAIEAYARVLMKYDLLSVTDGTKKRSDGTPVP